MFATCLDTISQKVPGYLSEPNNAVATLLVILSGDVSVRGTETVLVFQEMFSYHNFPILSPHCER